jgi:zinc protease
VLLDPVFPPEEIEKVRGQVLTGLKEAEDSTRSQAYRRFKELLYTPQHPYGRPVGGTLESIPGIAREDLIQFYQTHFRPDGAVIVVVGDVKSEVAREMLDQALGRWQGHGPPPEFGIPSPPTLPETRRQVHPMTNKSQADIILGTVGPGRLADDYYAASVGNLVLGQLGLGGRLGENVRDKQGLAYYAYSGLEAGLGRGPWSARAGVNPTKVDQAVETILAEIRRFCQEALPTDEVDDAKAYLTGVLPLRLETNEGIAGTLHQMEIFGLGDDYLVRFPDLIEQVSKEQILAAAQRYLDPDRYVLAIAGPYQNEQ